MTEKLGLRIYCDASWASNETEAHQAIELVFVKEVHWSHGKQTVALSTCQVYLHKTGMRG